MEEYQQRVIDEKTELDKKIENLKNFFSNPIYLTLSEEQQSLLYCQHQIMGAYSTVLARRIKLFNP
jgi:hypothetical protein